MANNNTNKQPYIIVSGGITEVQEAVNRAIVDGYEVQGGLCAYHIVSSNGNVKFLFAQSMILDTSERFILSSDLPGVKSFGPNEI